jgi:hypothetical protein
MMGTFLVANHSAVIAKAAARMPTEPPLPFLPPRVQRSPLHASPGATRPRQATAPSRHAAPRCPTVLARPPAVRAEDPARRVTPRPALPRQQPTPARSTLRPDATRAATRTL